MEIKFLAPDLHTLEVKQKPITASKFIPRWWKDMDVYSEGTSFDPNPYPNITAKKCFPLLDGITSGYIVTLWSDVFVKQTINGPEISWQTNVPVVESWSNQQTRGYEIPDGFSSTVFKYYHGWVIQTPPGYSCLITHPIGYPNLPIRTITGVVDTDSLKTNANSPFVVKNNFEGILEKGTPMFQIIPFKRDNWKSSISLMKKDEHFINNEKLRTKIISSYGRFLRKNKKYE